MDDSKLESYKLKNAELAIKLNEKRIELEERQAAIVERDRECQTLQTENAELKMQLTVLKDQLQNITTIVKQTVSRNTQEYSKMLQLVLPGLRTSTALQDKTLVANNNASNRSTDQPSNNQLALPQIVVTAPKDTTRLSGQPQTQQQSLQLEASATAVAPKIHPPRSPRSPNPYTPCGLSFIAEENTLDMQDHSLLTSLNMNESGDEPAFSSTKITSVDIQLQDNTASSDDDHAADAVPKKSPLTSVENIEQTKRKKPAPLSVQQSRGGGIAKSGKKISIKNKIKPPTTIDEESDRLAAPTTDDASGRPRRRAAPEHLVEPKMNTKMRRD